MTIRRRCRRRRADAFALENLSELERHLVRHGRIHHRGRCGGMVRFGTPAELRPIMLLNREHLAPGVTPDAIIDLSVPPWERCYTPHNEG